MTTLSANQVSIEERIQSVALIFNCKCREEAQTLYESIKAELDAGHLSLKLEIVPEVCAERLSREDSEAFALALDAPAAPNEKLKRLMKD